MAFKKNNKRRQKRSQVWPLPRKSLKNNLFLTFDEVNSLIWERIFCVGFHWPLFSEKLHRMIRTCDQNSVQASKTDKRKFTWKPKLSGQALFYFLKSNPFESIWIHSEPLSNILKVFLAQMKRFRELIFYCSQKFSNYFLGKKFVNLESLKTLKKFCNLDGLRSFGRFGQRFVTPDRTSMLSQRNIIIVSTIKIPRLRMLNTTRKKS